MKTNIVITTVSLIRTKEEKAVILETIKFLSKFDIPIIIVDGGSSEEDKKEIKNIPNVVLFDAENGFTEQLFLSQREAAKRADYLFFLQVDKLDFATDSAKRMVEFYNNLKQKGVLVPARKKESLDTYPSFQRTQEAFLNLFMSDYVGIDSDYFAGPKIYPSYLVKYLDQVKGELGWGIEAYFYVLAKRLGLPFDFIEINLRAPKDVDDEWKTKLYRLKITQWEIEGFLQAQNIKL